MSNNPAKTIKPAMHHVTFKTTRLQAMIDWYAAVVGTKSTSSSKAGRGRRTIAPTTASRF